MKMSELQSRVVKLAKMDEPVGGARQRTLDRATVSQLVRQPKCLDREGVDIDAIHRKWGQR